MAQHSRRSNGKLAEQILNFSKHIAGSCKIIAVCSCGGYALGLPTTKKAIEVLLVIRAFQPRLMSYVKVFDDRNIFVVAVDEWIFERDVDKGFLGEALAGRMIFPYKPLVNEEYLLHQEIKLKKRLILELLENLVLDYPELSCNFYIKPEYFLYETMLSRTRLFPPMVHTLLNFMQKEDNKKNVDLALRGYSAALKELEQKKVIEFSNSYVKITRDFADKIQTQKTRFINLLKTAQRTLFTSLLNTFPNMLNLLSQNKEIFSRIQKFVEQGPKNLAQIEDPQKYVYVPTSSGLVPLASRIDVRAFAKKVLSADEKTEVKIENIGGALNDVYMIKTYTNHEGKKAVVKRFRDWSSFKWFPLTLWTVGTRTFAVLARSRLERECAINQFLYSKGFAVPKILYISPSERSIFMEYIEGENASQTIKKIAEAENLDEIKNELDLIRTIGAELAKIHTLNVSLGDTKPENILIGKNGKIYLMDFEQSSRNGDKVWDIAEFLYYAGHDIPPFVEVRRAELITKAFVEGYLGAGGDARIAKKAANPKYTKVFSVFTFPHIIFAISNVCRKADKLKE